MKGIPLIICLIITIGCATYSTVRRTEDAYEKDIKSISATVAQDIAKAGKKTVAVVDFTDLRGNVTDVGRVIAEDFYIALGAVGKEFNVRNRIHLDTIDASKARELARAEGVDALVTGKFMPFEDSVRLLVTIFDATGKVIGGSSGNITQTEFIKRGPGRDIKPEAPTADWPTIAPPDEGVQAQDFVFKPVECRRSAGKLICTVSFQNNGNEERKLMVCGTKKGPSYLYDNLRNQYPVSVKIGRKVSKFLLYQYFIPKLPTNVQFIAEDVNAKATHVTVTISIKEFKTAVVVRDIPITK